VYLDVEGIIDKKMQLSALSTSADARAFSVKITQVSDKNLKVFSEMINLFFIQVKRQLSSRFVFTIFY
jgi:hypothetical protein